MMRTTIHRAAVAVLLSTMLSGCYELVDDYDFQLWCGDTLCAWDLEEGSIEKVPTWHERDYGVSFVDDPTSISQLVPNQDLYDECLRFEVVAHAEPGAELRLLLDFEDDGEPELERTLDREDWEQVEFYVTAPPDYGVLRIRLVKYGDADAVVARLRAQGVPSGDGCIGPPL